jgi:hypothetical protein
LDIGQHACPSPWCIKIGSWRCNCISKCRNLHHKGHRNILTFKNTIIFIRETHKFSFFVNCVHFLINIFKHSIYLNNTSK